MAQQFSLPQQRVLEELDGEGYWWASQPADPCSGLHGGTLIPSSQLHLGAPHRGGDWAPLGSMLATLT